MKAFTWWSCHTIGCSNNKLKVSIIKLAVITPQYLSFQMGAYHTLDLELNRKFELRKPEWDTIALERIEMACDPTHTADVAAVVMQEGLAFLCLITASMTLVRSKIEMSIPRKRKGYVQQHEKGLTRFYESVMQGILRHVNFDVVKCILIASPGFVRDQFYDYMFQQAVKLDIKVLLDHKSKFMLVHSSSGFKHALRGKVNKMIQACKMNFSYNNSLSTSDSTPNFTQKLFVV